MKAFGKRVAAMAIKETTHISRDKQVIYMALGMPVVLLLLFGYAISFDLDLLPMGLVDRDNTQQSRSLVRAMTASGAFEITKQIKDPKQVHDYFKSGDLKVALIIEPGFARSLKRAETATAQLVLDGTDGTTAGIALGYAAGVAQSQNIKNLEKIGKLSGLPIEARVRALYNPSMDSAMFIVPGLIAMILAIMATLLTAITVAREWETGSMEQLFSTPVGRLEILLGKLIPYIIIGIVQVLLVVSVGSILFEVPLKGSIILLFLTSFLFLACTMGQGLLISVLTKAQMVSTQAAMISTFVPTILLSGFMFPIQNMPWPLQAMSYVVPARYFIEALRGILLKGNGISTLWPDVLALTIIAVATMALATARFKRRLD